MGYAQATYASLMFPLLDTANLTEEGHSSTNMYMYCMYCVQSISYLCVFWIDCDALYCTGA